MHVVQVTISEWEAVNLIAWALIRGDKMTGKATTREALGLSLAVHGLNNPPEASRELLEAARTIYSKYYAKPKQAAAGPSDPHAGSMATAV